jgi:hypothetical protein
MKTYNYTMSFGPTLNTNINGPAMELKNMYGCAIQVVWTGTPNGVFKLQASSDPLTNTTTPSAPGSVPTHWTDIPASSYTVNAAGNYMWNVYDIMYNWVRVVYTDASGGSSTAVVTSAILNGKGV